MIQAVAQLFSVGLYNLHDLYIPVLTKTLHCAVWTVVRKNLSLETNELLSIYALMVEKELLWIFWMWCMIHSLELAVKDASRKTSFDLVDEMLLRLYRLYAKKCRQLEGLVLELRECLSIEDGGTRPIRASGSCWISHKWNVRKCVLSKYGAYTSHHSSFVRRSHCKVSW